jgi:hypothetical protein
MPKEEKVVHPKSRRAGHMHRAVVHTNRIEKQKGINLKIHTNYRVAKNQKGQIPRYKRTLHMHNYLVENHSDVERFTDEMMHEMVQDWLKAEDAKFEEEKARKRGKLSLKSQVAVTDRSLYEGTMGLEVPDLTDKLNLSKFLSWNTEMETVQGIKTKNMMSSKLNMGNIWKDVNSVKFDA